MILRLFIIQDDITNGDSGSMAEMAKSKGRICGGIVRRTLLQDSAQCLLNLEAFLHTLGDSRSAAGMTAKPAQPRLAFSANLRLTFPCIPLSTSRRFLKTFYYFSYHDQIASYRASL